jgi:hypothetical protein
MSTGRTSALALLAGLVLVLAANAAAGAAARSTTAGKPMYIGDRVLRAGELPGFSPRDTPKPVASVAAWNKIAPSGGLDVRARLRAAGFVSGVREDLRWRSGDDRGALSVVVRLGSAGSALSEIARELRDAADEPNRGEATAYKPFAVPGIPGAHGFSLPASDHTGENIIFADGPFIYWIGAGWGNQVRDPPTQADLIHAANILYGRVHGRPAPS